MSGFKITRRQALGSAGAVLVGARVARAGSPWQPASPPAAGASATQLVPVDELVNALEFEDQARLVLPGDVFATIAGSDRSAFDRLTFRPRMNVPTVDMDLGVDLFGDTHFTPIIVGPVSGQGAYHPDAEVATVTGAGAANTTMVVSSRSSVPIEDLAAVATAPLWGAVYADAGGAHEAQTLVAGGARAVLVTAGALYRTTGGKSLPAAASTGIDWKAVEAVRRAVTAPLALKGVTNAEDARRAADLGFEGSVVSNYGGLLGGSGTAPIDALRAVVDAVGDRQAILVDGSFRRATDFLAALILGARGVLIARPVMWALAGYGAEGVTVVLKLLQLDLARCFAMIGAADLAALRPEHIKIHTR